MLVLELPDTMTKPDNLSFDKVSLWIHFYNLPLGCRNRKMAIRLGNAVGSFEDVDCNRGVFCCGESLWVRVRYDISKALCRGIKLNIDGLIGGVWIPMKYERLPKFCSYCGKIGHHVKDCVAYFEKEDGMLKKKEYGPWLRYQGIQKKPSKSR